MQLLLHSTLCHFGIQNKKKKSEKLQQSNVEGKVSVQRSN
jgi:hypothetical protein